MFEKINSKKEGESINIDEEFIAIGEKLKESIEDIEKISKSADEELRELQREQKELRESSKRDVIVNSNPIFNGKSMKPILRMQSNTIRYYSPYGNQVILIVEENNPNSYNPSIKVSVPEISDKEVIVSGRNEIKDLIEILMRALQDAPISIPYNDEALGWVSVGESDDRIKHLVEGL